MSTFILKPYKEKNSKQFKIVFLETRICSKILRHSKITCPQKTFAEALLLEKGKEWVISTGARRKYTVFRTVEPSWKLCRVEHPSGSKNAPKPSGTNTNLGNFMI